MGRWDKVITGTIWSLNHKYTKQDLQNCLIQERLLII